MGKNYPEMQCKRTIREIRNLQLLGKDYLEMQRGISGVTEKNHPGIGTGSWAKATLEEVKSGWERLSGKHGTGFGGAVDGAGKSSGKL